MNANGVPAGWYPDPKGLPCERYWDGEHWSEETRPYRSTTTNQSQPLKQRTGVDSNEIGMIVAIVFLFVFIVLFTI